MREYETKVAGTYYFRRVVPPDLIGHFTTATGKPRKEWKYSLGTKDRREAARPLRVWAETTDTMIADARRAIAEGKAVKPAAELVDMSQRIPSAEADAMERASLEAAGMAYDDMLADEEKAEADPMYAAQRALRAAAAGLERDREDLALWREVKAEEAAAKRISVMELFDRYAAMPGRNAKTIAQWRPYLEKLVAFLGHDDASRVVTRDLTEWRNHLRDVETYRGNRLSPKTINGSYLAAVNVVFGWAADDGLLDTNPARDVKPVRAPKAVELRSRVLSDDEARTILRATALGPSGREGADFMNARRWVPWLMCYSGARVGEITQLRKEDIQTVAGIAAMRITPEAGQVKNKKARLVPLHPHLIEQGFLDFVKSRRAGPLFYDPGKRRSDAAINRQSNRLGSKIADWVRGLGVDVPQPNHSWRHRFVTVAQRHELPERATMAIVGHAPVGQNRTYGDNELDVLHKALCKIPSFTL